MARTAFITGASRGIGAAAATRLSEAGIKIIGVARQHPDGHFPGQFYCCDLADPRERGHVLSHLVAEHEVDIVINNVGSARIEPIGAVTNDALGQMWEVNFVAAIDTVQAFLPNMRARSWGRIVNVASGAMLGKAGRIGYAATKAALVGYSRTAALELAADGITVNVVSPGQIRTDLFLSNNRLEDPATKARLASIPFKRIGEPEEVAAAIAFFASAEAAYITGQVLHVCGGLTVGKAAL